MKQIICPISNEKTSEQITRLNALIGIALLILGFVFNSILFLLFLMADFYIRAFTKAKYSPISYVSNWLSNTLNLSEKRINKAPKVFAARLGFLMMTVIVGLFLGGLHTSAIVIASILVFFASLEFALAICVGCIIYTYAVLPFYK